MDRPPIYSKYAQFDDRCTCGKPLAIYQRKFENVTKENMESGMSLENSRIEAIKSLNIRKSCCLRELTHFAKNFIFDTTINAFCDITIVSNEVRHNRRNGMFNGTGGWEFLPHTIGLQCFDQQRYAQKLANLSCPGIDKSGFLRQSILPFITYLSFPNFQITEAEDFPPVDYIDEPPTLDELLQIERGINI